MKIRRTIFWPSLAAIALIAVIAWFSVSRSHIPEKTNVVTSAAENVASSSNITLGAKSNSVRILGQIQRPPRLSKDLEMQEGLSKENDVPIVFYGKLEDQFSNVLANTTVNFSVRVYNGTEATVKRGQVVSDANGLFTISGYKGESLGIGVKREGYAWLSMNGSGVYSQLYPENQRAHPDPNNPVIIKMWKLQGAQPLTPIKQRYKFHFTNAPVNFDLLAGKIVTEGGDIAIKLTRSDGIVSEQTLQDWGVQISALDGGLIEVPTSESRVTYELPDTGYQKTHNYLMSTNTHSWHGGLNRTFFLRSRNGQIYGKLTCGISINRKPDDNVSVEFHGEINQAASRNFESDADAMK
jgi:hypothetical protein